jgi:hypothetical protein
VKVDVSDFYLFVGLPKYQELIGPFDTNTIAVQLVHRTLVCLFVFVPICESKNPVFFIHKNKVMLISSDHLYEKYSDEYDLISRYRIVTKESELETGAIVYGYPKRMKLLISGRELELPSFGTYSDVQLEFVNGREDLATRVLFYSSSTFLTPEAHPTVRHLSNHTLDAVVMEAPATLGSLSLFKQITVELCSVSGKRDSIYGIWMPKEGKVQWICERMKRKFKSKVFLYVSLYSEIAIGAMKNPDSLVVEDRIRVDALKCELPKSVDDFVIILEKYGKCVIEVRTMTIENYYRRVKTLGFWEIDFETKVIDLFRECAKVLKLDLGNCGKFFIKGESEVQSLYAIDQNAKIIEAIMEMSKRGSVYGRPSLVIQYSYVREDEIDMSKRSLSDL